MKINSFILKSSFFFALIVFLLVIAVGIINDVEVNALLIRASVFCFISGALSVVVCLIIGKSIEEEMIVLKEREEEALKRKEEELKIKEAQREANPEHYI